MASPLNDHELNRAGRRAAIKSSGRRKAGAALTASSAALASMALFAGPGALPAGASTLDVNSLADTGDGTCDATCTLRDALDDANNGDVITFSVTGTINLATQLFVNDSVTIQGPGAGGVVVDGGDTTRVFYVTMPGKGAVTISGLTIQNGHTFNGGSAVLNIDEDLTLDNDIIRDNDASPSGYGGAVYNGGSGSNSNLVVRNTLFSGNTATNNGGAIAVNEFSSVTIENSTFTGNTTGGSGGAIYAFDGNGPVSITGSTFAGNTADDEGGAVAVTESVSSVAVTGSTFTGNTASDGEGGALNLYDLSGNVVISSTTISGNFATDDGGAGALIEGISGDITITDSVVSNNIAKYYGAGLYIDGVKGNVTISNTTVAGNQGGTAAGLEIFETGGLTILDSTFSGNISSGHGGAIYATEISSNVLIANSTISGNTAGDDGGGISFDSYYGLTLVQSTITQNKASTVGGVYFPTHQRGLAASTHGARSKDGGDVHRQEYGEASAIGTIISGNSGADVGSYGTLTAKNSLIGSLTGTTLVDQGGNLLGVNPLLAALADNGGATQTHALLPGSPAIDKGPNPPAVFPGDQYDQRGVGYARVVAGVVDIGAFEVQPIVVTPLFTG